MRTFKTTWEVEIEADSLEEANERHRESLAALDDAPCSVWPHALVGYGPVTWLADEEQTDDG